MEINLHRKWFTPESTIGEVYYSMDEGPKVLVCYSLEDAVRAPGAKIAGSTAIPTGKYPLIISWSERFKRLMPELLNVPNFRGVRIHPGNVPEDTDGCILLGLHKDVDSVSNSVEAYGAFCRRFSDALNAKDDITIAIHGQP